jgi:hypothetical protein
MVLGFLPVAFVGTLLVPEGVGLPMGIGEALGCGGTLDPGSAPGWVGLTQVLPTSEENPSVPVATDGFFAIEVHVDEMTAEAAQASMNVVVTDESGLLVPGETKLLSKRQEGWYLFGWTAKAPLDEGAELTAELSASPRSERAYGPIGGSFPLVVVGAPTPLPEPSLVFSAWADFFHGVGGSASSCKAESRYCSDGPIPIPATVTKQVAVDVTWKAPPTSGGVAWKPRVEASPSHPDAIAIGPSTFQEFTGGATERDLGYVTFPTDAESYCVTLVLEDLRTHEERRTEVCEKPQAAQRSHTDTRLDRCREPPSPALTEAWCRLREGDDPECAHVVGINGAEAGAGTSGASSGSGDGGHAGAGGPGSYSGEHMTEHYPGPPSKGCQIGVSRQTASGGALLFAALATLHHVRRRRRVR